MSVIISEALYKEIKDRSNEARPKLIEQTKQMHYRHAEKFLNRSLTDFEKSSIDKKVRDIFIS